MQKNKFIKIKLKSLINLQAIFAFQFFNCNI